MGFVFNSEPVTLVTTTFVEVAVPETVRPPAAVPLPIVVDAVERSPPVKLRSVEVALLGNR